MFDRIKYILVVTCLMFMSVYNNLKDCHKIDLVSFSLMFCHQQKEINVKLY